MSELSTSCSGSSSDVSPHRGALLRRGTLAVALVGASAVILSLPASAQRPVFRTGTQSVAVYATVQDSEGRLVPDLPREAFQIFEDGRPVDITAFSRDPQPLRVAMMLDTSPSAGGGSQNQAEHAAEVRDSIFAFVRALGPDDRASLGTFGAEIAVGANWTNDVAEFERVLQEEYWQGPGAGTPLWQALSESITALSGQPGRHVILALTDGEDTGSLPHWRGSRSTLERQVVQEDAMIYVVRPAEWAQARRQRPLPASVTGLAAASGGGHFEVPMGADLPAVFNRIAEELRHQYLLGFSPAIVDGKEHTIDVRVSRPGLKVRARRSHAAQPLRSPVPATSAIAAPEPRDEDAGHPAVGLESRPRVGEDGALTAVVLFDASWTVANIMATFIWDGSHDFRGKPLFDSGRRLPHRPADLFLAGLREGLLPNLEPGDRLRVGTISRQLRVSRSFTDDRSTLMAAARDVMDVPDSDRYGPSPIWDAVGEALTMLEEESGRRAIVLVTDGMPTGNKLGLSQIQRSAALLGIPVHVLQQRQAIRVVGLRLYDKTGNQWMFFRNPLGHSPEAMLQSLAAATGGMYVVDESVGRIERDAEGKYYPDPAAGRARTLIKHLERMMREIQKTRTFTRSASGRDRSEQGIPVRSDRR